MINVLHMRIIGQRTLYYMKGFRDIMSRDRFFGIIKFFHLATNEIAHPRDHPDYD